TIHIASRATARAMFKSFPEADQPICLEAAQFKFVNHTEDAEAFHWDFGDGQSATESSPEHTYHQPGQYQVILTTQEAGNPCPATDTLLITIAEDGELWIPETFTPNNDGINDAFRLHGPGVEELEFNIYDKNGELVHTLKSLEDRWTGTNHKGKNLPSGQYSYTLFARISNCHTQEKEGLITLKR
ncbi:MAG: gliding motility-associated C-terminal domain-containing protein, partial [Bacteroidota bacterium]